MKNISRTRGAFTLIEMLVVIAILSILLVVLIPALSTSRESARRTACRSNLDQIGKAFATYAADRDGWFPLKNGGAPVYDTSDPQWPKLGGEYPLSQHGRLLWAAGYLRSPKSWVCPSDANERSGTGAQLTVKPYMNPDFPTKFTAQGNCSYMYVAGYGDKLRFPTTQLDPTKFAVLLDESNDREQGDKTPGQMPNITVDDNHGANYRNVLYADGHVSAVVGKDVANATIFPEVEAHQYDKINSID